MDKFILLKSRKEKNSEEELKIISTVITKLDDVYELNKNISLLKKNFKGNNQENNIFIISIISIFQEDLIFKNYFFLKKYYEEEMKNFIQEIKFDKNLNTLLIVPSNSKKREDVEEILKEVTSRILNFNSGKNFTNFTLDEFKDFLSNIIGIYAFTSVIGENKTERIVESLVSTLTNNWKKREKTKRAILKFETSPEIKFYDIHKIITAISKEFNLDDISFVMKENINFEDRVDITGIFEIDKIIKN